MADPELHRLRERIHALQAELDKHKRATDFLETSETNLHLFARSLAHDFNNLLTGILGHAALIQSSSDAGEESREAAGVIYKAAERAGELAGQLMHFTRGAMGRALPVDIHSTVREVADHLRRSLEPNLHLSLKLDATKPHISGDAGQIHQMLLNLALNARDAMPDGGTMSFETSDYAGGNHFHDPAVMLTVRDTGSGIAPEILDTIFHPFFTTKPKGRGSGMGLAIVDRVVNNHRGKVTVETEIGVGSAFRVYLPVRRALPPSRRDG